MDIVPVQGGNHTGRLIWRAEIRKRQSSENPVIVVIVECVRERCAQGLHHAQKCFAGDGEWNVFDHDGGRDDIVVLGGYGRHGVAVSPSVGRIGHLRVLARDGVSAREADRSVAHRRRGRRADDAHGHAEPAFGVRWLRLVRVRLAGVRGGSCGNGGGGRERGGR